MLPPPNGSQVYLQATITSLSHSRWATRTDGCLERCFGHLWLPHLQLDELRTRLRCTKQVLWLWLAIDPGHEDSSRARVRPPHATHGACPHPQAPRKPGPRLPPTFYQ